MKAAVVHGKGDIRVEEYPTPQAAAGEMVVKIKASGICATDIKTLLGQGLPKELPTILGHEVVGEVHECGAGVTGFTQGERVAVYPIAVCGECYYCKRGRHNLCEKEFGLGHRRWFCRIRSSSQTDYQCRRGGENSRRVSL